MTKRDKFRMEHPECNADTIHQFTKCPSHYGYPNANDCIDITCEECWDREIPGTEKIGLTPEEKRKLYDFVGKLTAEERSALRNLIVLRDIEDYFLNRERKDV